MTESSTVRDNLMTEPGYTGYCGNMISRSAKGGCDNPRTKFDGEQVVCPKCSWRSQFPNEFIIRYKLKWDK